MYKKILLYFIIILFLCISIFSLKTYSYTKEEYYNHEEKTLTQGAKIIANNINSYSEFENISNNKNITQFSKVTNSRLTIINDTGVVVYDSEVIGQELENHATRPEVKGALQGDTSTNTRYSKTLDVDMMYVAVPINIDGVVIGVVRNSVSLDSLKLITNKITRDIVTTLLITLSISIFVFYFLIKGIIGALGETTEFAKEIANRNYKKRLSMIREDEIGSLAYSLNHMAQQLEYSFNELSQRNAQFESVLANIKNGMIAINEKNKIILMNHNAYEMLRLSKNKDLIGKNILEAIRDHDFYQRITHLHTSKEMDISSFETEIEDNLYSIYTKRMMEESTAKGFIIVIEDITQIRKLENIRKDFVANVTHELKTPITSIKGFIETLLNGDVKEEETRDKFYRIIDSEVNRLIRLVEDILTLSSLDSQSKSHNLEVESIDVRAHLEHIFDIMGKIALRKKVDLSYEIDEDIENITFNRNYFKQIMINLIDNAIKYNNHNGDIKVKIYPKENNVLIEVIDNGLGIPAKDLPRIFERFYRVDRGRSRQAGGTGLGLAIVKHMVQIQNSTIEVESTIGKGTKFTLKIPF